MKAEAELFRRSFERWARPIRRRKLLRGMLHGATTGSLVGIFLAGALFAMRLGPFRFWALAAGLIGAAIGLFFARRRAFSDDELALYLDACLGTHEVIASALELLRNDDDSPAREPILRRAIEALGDGNPRLARPRIIERAHWTIPASCAAIAYLAFLPPRPLPSPDNAPGSEELKLEKVAGLEKIEKLAKLDARDSAQRERLDEIAEEAKRLREKLRDGMEKREAQAAIAKLRDSITAEQLSLGDGDKRAGFEAAVGRLAQERALRDAAKALGDRDLKGFDDALEKLANQRERRDRELARKALEEAEELARKEGADDVAKMLAKSREELKKREERAELLRKLGEALGDSVKNELDDFENAPSGETASKLMDALGQALEQLSEEERQRLAERLKKELGDGALSPHGDDLLREYAEQLTSPEGVRELAEELRRLASEDFEGDEARRQEALEDAERGGAEAEGDITGRPMPLPMAGNGPPQGQGGEPGGSSGSGDSSKGQPGAGSGDDRGRGEHGGHTDPIDGDGLRSRTGGRIDKSIPMPGVAMGRAPGRPGETANVLGTGALPGVAPEELSGVERSEVPEEYREQVGRYFQP